MYRLTEYDLRVLVLRTSVAYAEALRRGASTQEAEWRRTAALEAVLRGWSAKREGA